MAIKRITISVPENVALKIKQAAGRTPVSQWVTEVVEDHLDNAALERLWREFCRDVRPTRADTRRARAIFNRLAQPPRKKAAQPCTWNGYEGAASC
jgi:hypothetical protein